MQDLKKMEALNLQRWIDEHHASLKPPIGNAQIWSDSEFLVTIVAGPNRRKDFHVDPGEEFFHQLKGDMILRVREASAFRDVPVREGDMLLLPPGVPHSPQRPAGSLGMVIERARRADEYDFFQWYCEQCTDLLHEVRLHVSDITRQLQPLFETFYRGDPAHRTCRSCGFTLEPPL